jgi:hypothetical protein
MAGHRTPAGVFSILQRSRFHRSNIYSNAPMPYMQRLTWSGVALHGGVVPGYPASHGCIRLPHRFAAELWGMTRLGTRVVVTPDDAVAVPIEHARLPVPRLTPASTDELATGAPAAVDRALVSAAAGTASDAGPPSPKVRLLDPLERIRAMKKRIATTAAAAARTAKLAVGKAAAEAAEARRASEGRRAAEQALEAARRRHDAVVEATGADSEPDADERASEALAATAAALADAARRAEEARVIETVLRDKAAAAVARTIEAENARREAAAALKASARAEEPISIFVSRTAGRVYIRQAWVPIHEAPVTFTDGGPALGTHVYLAMGAAADGESMRWFSVSLPPAPPRPSRQHGKGPARDAPATGVAHETAANALARFEFPKATLRFIEDRLWAGASLIVSDNGISHETGPYSDFVVLTR